jgi:hypothetical protein
MRIPKVDNKDFVLKVLRDFFLEQIKETVGRVYVIFLINNFYKSYKTRS